MHTTLPRQLCCVVSLTTVASVSSFSFAGLSIDWTVQQQRTRFFASGIGDFSSNGSGTIGWTNHSDRTSDSMAASGDPFLIHTSFRTILEPIETGRGRVISSIFMDPGFSNSNLGLWGVAEAFFSSRFQSDESITVLLDGIANVSGRYPGDLPTYILVQRQGDDQVIFSWSHRGFPNDTATLNAAVALPAGAYELTIITAAELTQPRERTFEDPAQINLDFSFAIIPAPSTLLPLAALPFLTSSRRRRTSGR